MSNAEDRFFSNIEPVPECGCWLWSAGTQHGYGSFRDDSGRSCRAHRYSFAKFVAPIPRGMSVCHRCDTPACVNPAHLFLGTQLDNVRDASRKGRLAVVRRNQKISAAQAAQIAARVAEGEHKRALAREFGVSPKAIRYTLQRARTAARRVA